MEEEYSKIDRENRLWIGKKHISPELYEKLTLNERKTLHYLIEGKSNSSNLQRRNLFQKLAFVEARDGHMIDAINDEILDEFFSTPLTPGEKLDYGRKF